MNKPIEKLMVKCPRCRTEVSWADNLSKPFCSEKCRLVDLGLWASEEYRVAGEKVEFEEGKVVPLFPGEGLE